MTDILDGDFTPHRSNIIIDYVLSDKYKNACELHNSIDANYKIIYVCKHCDGIDENYQLVNESCDGCTFVIQFLQNKNTEEIISIKTISIDMNDGLIYTYQRNYEYDVYCIIVNNATDSLLKTENYLNFSTRINRFKYDKSFMKLLCKKLMIQNRQTYNDFADNGPCDPEITSNLRRITVLRNSYFLKKGKLVKGASYPYPWIHTRYTKLYNYNYPIKISQFINYYVKWLIKRKYRALSWEFNCRPCITHLTIIYFIL